MGWLKSIIRRLAPAQTPVAEVGRKFRDPIVLRRHHGRNRKERRAFEWLTAAQKRRSLTAHEAKQYTILQNYGA